MLSSKEGAEKSPPLLLFDLQHSAINNGNGQSYKDHS